MRLAVVGAGVSGLVAAWVLSRVHDVVLYEAEDRPGGHTNTVDVPRPDGATVPVDTGFIVFNAPNYPGFCRLLEILGVASRPSDMSFSVSDERTGLEYRGSGLATLFAQRRNLLGLRVWRMLAGILRFHRQAPRRLARASYDLTLGAFLEREGYSRPFVDHYLVPMGAALWSADPRDVLCFPARSFMEFFRNHGFLQVRGRPVWRTIRGGSRTYVEALLARFGGTVRLGTPVSGVERHASHVALETAGGSCERFDAVVLAAHGDQAFGMLRDPSPAEREVMGAFRCRENDTLLHGDERVMPRTRRAWSSWNVHVPRSPAGRATVTYHANRLQGIAGAPSYFVTLNRTAAVDPDAVIARIPYRHPVYDPASHRARARWREVSGTNRTHYCGAYWSYGFHEDGVQSALRVCRDLGADLPA